MEEFLAESLANLFLDEEIEILLNEWGDDDGPDYSYGRPALKGWMSPSGKAHLIDPNKEHYKNHHPEFEELRKNNPKMAHATGYASIGTAQKHGFVRFGHLKDSAHGSQPFVHYDSKHPHGAKTAMKAMHYMKPHHNEMVSVTGSRGLWVPGKHGGTEENHTALSDLDKVLPASEAYRHLYKQTLKKKKA